MPAKKRLHIALGVRYVAASIKDYSKRLGCRPEVVISGKYALWRTPFLNLSIRHDPKNIGRLRHLGFENPRARRFTNSSDVNGIVWEEFSVLHQRREIAELWPRARLKRKSKGA